LGCTAVTKATLAQQLRGQRFGLVLSAGYFGFYGHAGFVAELLAQGFTPAAWAGTSAGGMIAGFHAAGASPQQVAALLATQRREHFWDPDPLGIAIDAVRGGPRASGLLRGDRFARLLDEHLPAKSFEDCPAPLLLVATNLSSQSSAVLRSGPLASAIHATCAYPGLFSAVRREGQLLWDGGLVDKAPVLALQESALGGALEGYLVHYLPSRDGAAEPKGLLAYPTGLAAGVAALRKDHFRLQLELLAARGKPVHVITSVLPKVTPRSMESGAAALEAGRLAARAALAAPPPDWAPQD
jgi:NTE family protein